MIKTMAVMGLSTLIPVSGAVGLSKINNTEPKMESSIVSLDKEATNSGEDTQTKRYIYNNGKLEEYSEIKANEKDALVIDSHEFKAGDELDIEVEK
ncbi:hypothetical protein DF186_11060 [Enterococcus hirae]|uniref:hypothetical protein n=1 Tax=Enterococcus hirae TaxID=1354 RepID=UPI000BA10339|nr:hypothetical protein [Enterococcus hirae]OZS41131.1 hypothetical protein CHB54_00015 [Enterococcus hirae]PWG75780.1 hypothetical protein DF186_11060 [Enterococcus hirae]